MKTTRVLVVDDSAITRALLIRTLERAGFTVIEAQDGIEGAVVALRERPDVVVTDLEMPTMDGTQLLRLLKSDPATAHAPVLIVTSHGEAPSRYWGLQTGADAYLTKDHRPEELVEAVTRLFAAAPPPAEVVEALPEGPLEVLARVARHLDRSLMQATVVNALLEQGMGAASLHEACRITLKVVAEVVDARLLGVGLAEPDTVTLHLLLAEPLALHTVDRCASSLIAQLDMSPGADISSEITGDREGDVEVDVDSLVSFQLSLRDANGRLVVLPRSPGQFASVSRRLVEAVTGHLALVLDNARLAQRLRELSMRDGLTKIYNHRAIHDRLGEELARASRYGHPLAVIICDLDHFKRVNDAFGHLAGDAVLRGAAKAMEASLRSADLFGRYGGEEFLAVLPETDLAAALHLAERMRDALTGRLLPLPAGGTIGVTGSFGVAGREELDGEVTADRLVTLADERLYAAKAAGRDCVRP